MSLQEILGDLVASEPFERMLLERARPILARAEAGQDFVIAGVATALESPVLAVTAGPREAEALEDDVAAFLGDDRVAMLPAWEALPYEQISPSPEVAARRADALHRLREARDRSCWSRRASPRCRVSSPRWVRSRRCSWCPAGNSRPTTWPSASSTSATRGPTWWSTEASSPCGVASSTSSRYRPASRPPGVLGR